MNRLAGSARSSSFVLVTLSCFFASGLGLYWLGSRYGLPAWLTEAAPGSAGTAANSPLQAGDIDPETGRRILYWHDPMVPGQRFDRPGRSPFMNMNLVPVYEGAGEDGGAVEISPRTQQNLGIRTAVVTRGTIAPRIEAIGNVAYNERDQVIVEARAMAFVETLYLRATLDPVRAGEPLAELYVPSWIAAQEEFLAVAKMEGAGLTPLVDAARQRMRQAGMTDEQIRLVESSGTISARTTLLAPIDGIVVELATREGMTVMPGETLYRINGIDTVWVNAEIPERQAVLVRPGAAVEARSAALPNAVFAGFVQAILPEIDPATRTLRARVELGNPERSLVPGMFVSISLAGPASESLIVPTEAIIETGRRTVVIRAEPNGTFAPADVGIGLEANGQTEITTGLREGDRIVVSGQFLIDSEASLRSAITRMDTMSEPAGETITHEGEGRIEALARGQVTLSHGPIPSLQWGQMTMRFALPAEFDDAGLTVGEPVRFRFVMRADGQPEITTIEPSNEDPQ